jgi:hypothetical protein
MLKKNIFRNRIGSILFLLLWSDAYFSVVYGQNSNWVNLREIAAVSIPHKEKELAFLEHTLRKHNDTLFYFSTSGIEKYKLNGEKINSITIYYWRRNVKGIVYRKNASSIIIRSNYHVLDNYFLTNLYPAIVIHPISRSGRLMSFIKPVLKFYRPKICYGGNCSDGFIESQKYPGYKFVFDINSTPYFSSYKDKIILSLRAEDSIPPAVVKTCLLHTLDGSAYKKNLPLLSVQKVDWKELAPVDSLHYDWEERQVQLSPPFFVGEQDTALEQAAIRNEFYAYGNSVCFAVDTLKERVFITHLPLSQIKVCDLNKATDDFCPCIDYFDARALKEFPRSPTFRLPKPIDSRWEKKEIRYWEKKSNLAFDSAYYYSRFNYQLYFAQPMNLLIRVYKAPNPQISRKDFYGFHKKHSQFMSAIHNKPTFLQVLNPDKPGALIAEIPVPPHFRILDAEPGGVIWAVKEVNKKEIIVAKYRLDLEGLKEGKNEKE